MTTYQPQLATILKDYKNFKQITFEDTKSEIKRINNLVEHTKEFVTKNDLNSVEF